MSVSANILTIHEVNRKPSGRYADALTTELMNQFDLAEQSCFDRYTGEIKKNAIIGWGSILRTK